MQSAISSSTPYGSALTILLDQLSESLPDYYRRCLSWAAKNLIWQYGACDSLAQLFVHARVGVEHVKPLTEFAQTLLTHGRPNGSPGESIRRYIHDRRGRVGLGVATVATCATPATQLTGGE